MSTYQRVPNDEDDDDEDVRTQSKAPARRLTDPRFNPPPPPAWKRAALIVFIIFLFWLAYSLRPNKKPQQEVIYASRYVYHPTLRLATSH
ncbi:hypothetical protein EDC04DRAFT_2732863 [Pisolithus marmoratus]|nr:hypothetical protein EDC04DRAFT_2732863 [Pisolithus marmoratus]